MKLLPSSEQFDAERRALVTAINDQTDLLVCEARKGRDEQPYFWEALRLVERLDKLEREHGKRKRNCHTE